MPEDALRVTLMGLKPGGKQGKKMRPTTWVSNMTMPPTHIYPAIPHALCVQNGKEQRLQFAEGDTLLFDFSKPMPLYDTAGNAVVERNTMKIKNKITGLVKEKEVFKQVLQTRLFKRGVVSANGPLAPLIGWAVGQKKFLMQRGQWPANGLRHKCGAKAKDHTGTCCSTGLMYQQPDFQANTSKLGN